MMRALSRGALVASLAVALAGCGTSPPVSFFTLPAEAPTASVQPGGAPYFIVVGPVTVPEVVDRPQLVLRASPTRVQIAEQARWAAPLKGEIPRVIASQLARLVPGSSTAIFSQRAATPAGCRVTIDIERFESTLGESAAVEATWTVRPSDGTLATGRTVATESAGAGYDELVAAHTRALGAVSRDIAAAIATRACTAGVRSE